jgi:membrane AbrB-like protein
MRFPSHPALRSLLLTLFLGVAAALIFDWLDSPLPWMIGPLFATAAARMAGAKLRSTVQLREAGQWTIGTALGMYFTPAVLAILASFVGFIAAGVAFAVILGAACGWLLHKTSGVDKTTAFFAMAIGGASEMAVQGERHGAAPDRVAAAHALRILLVVAIIPFAFQFWGVHGSDPYVPGTHSVNYVGLACLLLLTSLCAIGFRRMNWPNAWMLGPLLASVTLTAFEVHLSTLPEWMIHLGQLFIGISLGTRFTPEFLHTAPRYLASVALCTIAAILVAAAFAMSVAALSGIHQATAILATSPGGIAEMSLTAKTLQLGVPIVTAFHVTRISTLLIIIGPMFRLTKRLRTRLN